MSLNASLCIKFSLMELTSLREMLHDGDYIQRDELDEEL